MNNPRFWIILCVCVILIKYMFSPLQRIYVSPAGPEIILFILVILPLILLLIPFLFVWAIEDHKINAANKKQRISEAAEKREKKNQEYAAWVREKEHQYKKNMEIRNPQLREMTENIFSDIRDYKISNNSRFQHYFALNHQLNIVVFINGNIRRFEYTRIYKREIEDIEREMKADKISKKVNPKSSNSIKYCFRRYAGCRNEAESGWRYSGHCKQCYQDYVETTDDD